MSTCIPSFQSMLASNPNPSGSFNIGASTTEFLSQSPKYLKIGVVYCSVYDYSSRNVLVGIWDFLKEEKGGGELFISVGGIKGLLTGDVYTLHASASSPQEVCIPYYFKFLASDVGMFTMKQCSRVVEIMRGLKWDGLVVIEENEAIVNAQVLTEMFRTGGVDTHVVGCRGTIDWHTCDWDANFTKVVADVDQRRSIGRFDQVCKKYCQGINRIVQDAQLTRNCYHFVSLGGFAASLKTLKCALETHPNLALIGEEVFNEKKTLKEVANEIVDVICERFKLGFNYGVILIPKSLLNFIVDFLNLCKQRQKQYRMDHSDTDYSSESDDDSDSKPDSECETKLTKLIYSLKMGLITKLIYSSKKQTSNTVPLEFDAQSVIVELVKTELEKRQDYKETFKEQLHYLRIPIVDRNSKRKGIQKMGMIAGDLIEFKKGNLASVKKEGDDWNYSPALLTDLVKEVEGGSRKKNLVEWELVKDTVILDDT